MALKGVNDGYRNPLERTGLRTAWTQPEGGAPAYMHECRVVNVNLVNWTVDVRTQFDNKFFGNIQVASPYMHPNRGEGIYVMPEVNSKCIVCLPSDGPPPFVASFIMPVESVEDFDTDQVQGTTGMGPSTFQGGRPRAKPGDIFLRGRDGQFVVLHRGGVLQVGSTSLAQRMYIPLGNIITDISQNYEHHNTGGSIRWGITSSSTDKTPETEFVQTFRVLANDEKADVRVAIGKVLQPTPEPAGEDGEISTNAGFGLGRGGDNPVVCEVAIAPQGFETESGAPTRAQDITTFKFVFDKTGNAFMRAEGNVNIRIKKKLRIRADQDITFSTKGLLLAESSEDRVRIQGNKGVEIVAENGVVTINGGATPVAVVGSAVDVLISIPVPIITPVGPGVISPGARLTGFIANGSSTVLAPPPG